MVLCSQSGTLEGHPHHWHWPWLAIREFRITQVCKCWGSGSQCSQAKKGTPRKILKHQLNMWGNDWVAKGTNPYKQPKLLREKISARDENNLEGSMDSKPCNCEEIRFTWQVELQMYYIVQFVSKSILERESQFNSVHKNFSCVSLT